MFSLSQTESLQLEISSYCNAACPQCPRNIQGGATVPNLPLTNWSVDQFEHVIDQFVGANLSMIYFCGTYGDPLMNPHIIKMCELIRKKFSQCRIGIHTNGGLQHHALYKQLAKVADFCAFGIDGLEDTNHLYRRKVSWSKLIENAQAFIDSGGYAIWDFIVFEHNQHQVESAKQISIDLGFKEFNVKKTSRFISRRHEISSVLDVYDREKNIEYQIKVPTDDTYINKGYQKISKSSQKTFQTYLNETAINCNSCRIKEIYIGSEGLVFPCGWLHDRLYCEDARQHKDHATLQKLFAHIGGTDKANIFHNRLQEIVDRTWFPLIEKQWKTNSIERCALMCGSNYNIIGDQNQEIDYKE